MLSKLEAIKQRAIRNKGMTNGAITWSQEQLVKIEDTFQLKVRKYVYGVISNPEFNEVAKFVSYIMSIIIIGSVLQFSLETVYEINHTEEQIALFFAFDLFFNIVFSMDYFGKIVFCPNYKKLPKLITSPSWIVDMLSVLPFYIELALQSSSDASVLRVIRIVRIFRIFRLLKASKNLKQVHMMFSALKKSRDAVIMLLMLLTNCLIFFGAFVYFSELDISTFDENGVLSYTATSNVHGFQSIPHTMWYTIVTMTTVGYGDMYLKFM